MTEIAPYMAVMWFVAIAWILYAMFRSRGRTIEAKDAVIEEQRRTIAAHESKISALELTLRAKNRQITALTQLRSGENVIRPFGRYLTSN